MSEFSFDNTHRSRTVNFEFLILLQIIHQRVIPKKLINIPENQEKPAADLLGRTVAKIDVDRRIVSTVKPAHYVHPHLFLPIVEFDRVSPSFLHLPPILAEKGG